MSTISGFKLTLPDGSVFRASSNNVRITAETNMQYLVGGPGGSGLVGTGIAYAAEWVEQTDGQSGKGDGLNQQAAVGMRGVHTIEITFVEWEEHTDTWGDAASSDSALTKMSELDRKLNTVRIDSESPADLEWGEYNSSGGDFGAVPVMLQGANLTHDATEESSTFTGSMTWFEAMDLTATID